ncbi:MAG TPA: hypothetical protein VKB51_11675 [bacterium]|nr:hypothetical protein [bacterium]
MAKRKPARSAPTTPAAGTPLLRLPLLVLGIASLLAGLWAGLLRLPAPWPLAVPAPRADWVLLHGPLMVSAFLGTVIGLERAVGLRRRWAYAGPVLTGLGGLVLIAGLPGGGEIVWGAALATAGSAVLVGVFAVVVARQPADFTATMGLGALAWLMGNALWLAGLPIADVVPWWMAFLVLTIAGERLELTRLQPPSRLGRALFRGAAALLVVGLLLHPGRPGLSWRLVGLAFVGLAAWLLRYDIARRTVRQQGLTRFMAVCLLGGYAWLAVAGLSLLVVPPHGPSLPYDAALHALFLGFVFVMIFAHAPVIFPAVLRQPMAYTPGFYAHLALLHVSLLLRVGGDWAGWWPGRQWGGTLAVLAILLFLANTVLALRAARR